MINSLTVMTSRRAYDGRGVIVAADPYRKIEAGWLVEYGLTREVTLIANPVVRDIALESAEGAVAGRGLSSFEVGARWRLLDHMDHAVSFQALTRIPAKSDPILPFENRPRTELRFGYGVPARINGKPGFVDSSIAWVKRHELQADEVRFEMTYGWWQRRDRMLLVQYFNTLYPGSGLPRDPRQHKIQSSTVYKLNDEWSVQFGSFFTRGGLQTRRERGTLMAVWRSF